MAESNSRPSMAERLPGCLREDGPSMQDVLYDGSHLVMILVASVVVLIQASRICAGTETGYFFKNHVIETKTDECYGLVGWAFACSFISTVTCLTVLIAPKLKMPMMPERYTALFLTVWWGIGACSFTFDGPFFIVGNGYFGSWLAFGGACLMLARYIPFLESAVNHTVTDIITQLAMASVMNLIASVVVCAEESNKDTCTDEEGFAVAASTMSTLAALIVIQFKVNGKPLLVYAVCSSVWWIFATGVMTFRDPFTYVGNGWFSAWACLLLSIKLAATEIGLEMPSVGLKPAKPQDSFRWFENPEAAGDGAGLSDQAEDGDKPGFEVTQAPTMEQGSGFDVTAAITGKEPASVATSEP